MERSRDTDTGRGRGSGGSYPRVSRLAHSLGLPTNRGDEKKPTKRMGGGECGSSASNHLQIPVHESNKAPAPFLRSDSCVVHSRSSIPDCTRNMHPLGCPACPTYGARLVTYGGSFFIFALHPHFSFRLTAFDSLLCCHFSWLVSVFHTKLASDWSVLLANFGVAEMLSLIIWL